MLAIQRDRGGVMPDPNDGMKVFHFEDGSVLCEECASGVGYDPAFPLPAVWVRLDGTCDSCGVKR